MTETRKHQLDELSISDILSYLCARCSSMEECIRRERKQLTKAKEVIKQFLNDYPVITKELLDKLEQFLKETKDIREDSTLDGDWVVDEH